MFGVRPDLLSLGKGMANGYALTALVGRREYMARGGLEHHEPRCFLLSTTNGAERSALAAGLATVRFYQKHDVIERLYATGKRLMDGLTQSAERYGVSNHVRIASDFACRPALTFLDHDGQPSMEYGTLFVQELMRRGVFLSWVCPSYRHGESEMAHTLEAFDGACSVYRLALEQKSVRGLLEGPPARPVFRTYNQCLQGRCGRLHADVPRLDCCVEKWPEESR
jgi:glutamate-1-semialdehyde 2,1-aminomutase